MAEVAIDPSTALRPAQDDRVVGGTLRVWQAAGMPTDSRLLRIHAADNVLTVTRTIEVGDELLVEGVHVIAAARLPLGHKVAARAIAADEKIVKYGAPIGSATCAIAAGEHVHTQNLRSDYIPTFARGEGAHYEHA